MSAGTRSGATPDDPCLLLTMYDTDWSISLTVYSFWASVTARRSCASGRAYMWPVTSSELVSPVRSRRVSLRLSQDT